MSEQESTGSPQRGVRVAVLGDLHYEPEEQTAFDEARRQVLSFEPDAVVNLGDLGGYSHCGTRRSFEEGREFLSSFGKPYYPLIGNHDMEGPEFARDEDAVSAWCDVFEKESPYYAVDLGHTIFLFLSSTGYRENPGSCHEVRIDDEQWEWFRQSVEDHKDTPIFVFSHCPILGSGIRVLQNLHLRIPNAYLNHSSQPEKFLKLVQENPQIKLWFSAHNHFGQNYRDSVNRVGACTFVHTGVIADISRDGEHHSRFLEFGDRGFVLSTLDHDKFTCEADVLHEYKTNDWERYTPYRAATGSKYFPPPAYRDIQPLLSLDRSDLCLHENTLLEYDNVLQAPVGVVAEHLEEPPHITEDRDTGGKNIIVKTKGREKKIHRNADGRYYKIHFPNNWNRSQKSNASLRMT